MADEKKEPVATAETVPDDKYAIREHWKCLAACTLMSLCPFQYGIDFGLIGGMQAMVGFLRASPRAPLVPSPMHCP